MMANRNKLLLCLIFFLGSSCAFQNNIQSVSSFDDIEYPFEVNKVQLPNNIEIAFFDEGSGDQTILFVHGLGSYAPAWKKNIQSLSENYRCIALDLPGYGKSSKGKYKASITFYADIIHSFCKELGLERVNIAGHSMGGQISIMTALAFPELINHLILVAPAGFETFTPGQSDWLRDALTPTSVKVATPDQIKANIGWNFHNMPSDAFFMVTDRIAMRTATGFDAYCYIIPKCVEGMVDEPVFDYLNSIQQKTLVIFGKHDNLIPNRYLNPGTTMAIAEKGADQIKNCQLEIIEKAGHFVQFEQADQVNMLVKDFLK